MLLAAGRQREAARRQAPLLVAQEDRHLAAGHVEGLVLGIVEVDRDREAVRSPHLAGQSGFLDLVAQGAQHLDLDQVLRAAGSPLHADQVIDGCDQHLHPAQVGGRGRASEVGVAIGPGGGAQEVQVAGIGLEGEDVSGPERANVRLEGQPGLDAAELGMQIRQCVASARRLAASRA